jgi:stearoyl-CoA desaturase (delta-9 desaturase)
MVTKEWVAIHRKHHGMTDQKGDPHSPQLFGIWKVLFGGAMLYNTAAKDKFMVNAFGKGTPNDNIEKNLYTPFNYLGIFIYFSICLALFGAWGILIWAIQMIWIPFWAAGVINGAAHWIGYRNGVTRDHSRNISPWGVVIGGEELHNNHHLAPASAKLSVKPWEFDIGWMYIRLLSAVKLAHVK